MPHCCPSSPCPICNPRHDLFQPVILGGPQRGCICPPTSEKTCESETCPRKPFHGFKATCSTVNLASL